MLDKVIAFAYQDKKVWQVKGYSNKALAFANDLKKQIHDRWTNFHQTYDLLRVKLFSI